MTQTNIIINFLRGWPETNEDASVVAHSTLEQAEKKTKVGDTVFVFVSIVFYVLIGVICPWDTSRVIAPRLSFVTVIQLPDLCVKSDDKPYWQLT